MNKTTYNPNEFDTNKLTLKNANKFDGITNVKTHTTNEIDNSDNVSEMSESSETDEPNKKLQALASNNVFKTNVKEWIGIDDKIKELTVQIKELRDQKKDVEEIVLSIMKEHGRELRQQSTSL